MHFHFKLIKLFISFIHNDAVNCFFWKNKFFIYDFFYWKIIKILLENVNQNVILTLVFVLLFKWMSININITLLFKYESLKAHKYINMISIEDLHFTRLASSSTIKWAQQYLGFTIEGQRENRGYELVNCTGTNHG